MNDETTTSGDQQAEQAPKQRATARRTAARRPAGAPAGTGAPAGSDAPSDRATPAGGDTAPTAGDATPGDAGAGDAAAKPARSRRTTKSSGASAPATAGDGGAATDDEAADAPAGPAPVKKAPARRRSTAAAGAPTDGDGPAKDDPADGGAPAKAPARRTTRKAAVASTGAAAEQTATEQSAEAPDVADGDAATKAAPARRTTSRTRAKAPATSTTTARAGTTAKAADTAEPVLDVAVPEAAAEVPAAPRKTRARRATKPAASPAAGEAPAASGTSAALADLEQAIAAPDAAAPDAAEPRAAEPRTGTAGAADAAEDEPQRPARSRRRASAPARSPEQRLDVFAELGAARPDADEEVAEDEETSPEDVATAETAQTAAESGATEDAGPRLPAAALLFQAPDPSKARPRRRRVEAPAGAPEAGTPRVDEAPAAEAPAQDEPEVSAEGGDEEGSTGRRRRRRGGRGRRNRGGPDGESQAEDESGDEEGTSSRTDRAAGAEEPQRGEESHDEESHGAEDDGAEAHDGEDHDEDESSSSSSRRRRRRRRSSGSGSRTAEPESGGRTARDEVTALKGSTRLEAKRQRRREGREAGRRRPTITESEFLARREAVDRKMIVREKDGLNQIAVLEDDILVEHYVARHTQTSMVGNVYLGRVQNVLPSMEAAFIDLGKGRNAVLYAGEVNWDAAGMEGQPRRIEQALKSGDAVLVQVTKDPIGHKGARLTAQITLAGRHLVLVPSGAMTGISRKLPENERARLKKLLKEIVPAGAGVIVRTAAEGASEEQLRADVDRLTKQWADIEAKAKNAKSAPVLLKGEPELAVRVVRDVFNEDFASLVVSGDTAWRTISTYVEDLSPDLADRMHHWTDRKDIFTSHRVDEQLAKAMDRKVWLPSGGSLVIDRTEAMTVVDVNTGKFTGSGGTLEETVTRNNIEAAEEIVRQLRLRDIGGIIVIDFIDMVLESNRDLVMRRLVECLGRDRTRHQVAEVTSLGLVQMTRKRVGQGLVEAFSTPCEHCNGRGFIVHDQPVERSGESHSYGSDDGGSSSRRRGRRGGEQAAEPAPEPVAEDPQTVAAREAVKATLATIAAAAASAHHEDGDAADGAKAAVADEPTGSAERAVEPAEDVASTTDRPAATGGAAEPEPGKDAPAARRRPARRRATAPASAPASSTVTEPTSATAASVPATTVPGVVDAAPAVSGVIGAPSAAPATATDAAPDTTETNADEPAEPAPAVANEPAEPAPAVATSRPRRSRRAVSRGVVTPGETPIVTLRPEA